MYLNSQPITEFQAKKQFSFKVETDRAEIEELYTLINGFFNYLEAGGPEMFVMRELSNIADKLNKRLNSQNTTKSLSFNYFEAFAIFYLHQQVAKLIQTHIKYPQFTQLVDNLRKQIPSNILFLSYETN